MASPTIAHHTTGPDASGHVFVDDLDIIIVPPLTASRTWVLQAGAHVLVTRVPTAGPHELRLERPDGSTLAVLPADEPGFASFVSYGGRWVVSSFGGAATELSEEV